MKEEHQLVYLNMGASTIRLKHGKSEFCFSALFGLSGDFCLLSAVFGVWSYFCLLSALFGVWCDFCLLSALFGIWGDFCLLTPLFIVGGNRIANIQLVNVEWWRVGGDHYSFLSPVLLWRNTVSHFTKRKPWMYKQWPPQLGDHSAAPVSLWMFTLIPSTAALYNFEKYDNSSVICWFLNIQC